MKILVVDDHPMTVDGCISALKSDKFSNVISVFEKAHNCEDAYKSILNAARVENVFDLVILDYNLPSFKDLEISFDGMFFTLYLWSFK